MSGFNVIRHADAVHVLTDGAVSQASGETTDIIAVQSKAWISAHLSAVVVVQGAAVFAPLLHHCVSIGATSFDHLREIIIPTIEEARAWQAAMVPAMDPEQNFCVVVAGWSETSGPASYAVLGKVASGLPARQVLDLGEMSSSPGTAEFQKALATRLPHVKAAADVDPERDGRAIMQIQREMTPGEIGGFVQLTTVRHDSITTKILHRWTEEGV